MSYSNGTMKNVDDQFRKAFIFLKKVHKPTIATLATEADCTPRHIQGILSEREKRGIGSNIGHKIATFFNLDYSEMLELGVWILEGKEPHEWPKLYKINPKKDVTAQKVLKTTLDTTCNAKTEDGSIMAQDNSDSISASDTYQSKVITELKRNVQNLLKENGEPESLESIARILIEIAKIEKLQKAQNRQPISKKTDS